jgi:hypothetical protein
MQSRTLTMFLVMLGLVAGAMPASSALAQDRHQGPGQHNGGQHDGGDRHAGGPRHGDRGRHGAGPYWRNRHDARGPGFGLGIVIGTYGGRPFYCRNHRHWRWNYRLQRYVYAPRGRC